MDLTNGFQAHPYTLDGQGDMSGSFTDNPQLYMNESLTGFSDNWQKDVPDYQGDYTTSSDQGDMSFDPRLSAGFLNYLKDNNYNFGYKDQGNNFSLNSLFGPDGKQVGNSQTYRQTTPDQELSSILSTVSPMITGGINQMNPGSALFDNPLTQKIFNTALSNAGVSAASGGNPLTGAITGGVNAAIPGFNVAGQVGIENPALQNMFNRGLQGASTAALNGGDVLQGTVAAAAPAALGYAGNALMPAGDMPDVGTLGGTMQDAYGESSATLGGQSPDAQIAATASLPQSMQTQIGNRATEAASPSVNTGKVPAWAQALSGAFGLYSNYDQMRRMRGASRGLSGLFSPNSPYAKQLRQTLERQDAKRGRRSDYAGRETQLAAALAERNMQMTPTLANLQTAENQSLMGLFNNALKLGTNQDVTSWLGGLFKG